MDDTSRGKRLIFVGGAPRSGTTLVQNMLDSHPGICGAPEFFRIPDILELRRRLHHLISIELIDSICSYEDVDRCISCLIESLLLPLADKQGRTYLSEKTPQHVLVFSELLRLFPGAHFIHVVRDPRAVISSLLQVGKRARKKGKTPASYAAGLLPATVHVQQCLTAGLAASQAAPERVLTLVYEQLIANPEAETKNICKFLKIEWSEQMLYPSRKEHLGQKAQTNEIWYDKRTYNRDPQPEEVDKWRAQLSPIQQVIIARSFEEIKDLAHLGYDLSLKDFPRVSCIVGTLFSQIQRIVTRARLRHGLRVVFSPVHQLLDRVGA